MLGKPFHRPGWIYEEKYDGWRMLAIKDGPRVRLISRQAVDHTERFRELADAIGKQKTPTLVLDGEVCVSDKDLVSLLLSAISVVKQEKRRRSALFHELTWWAEQGSNLRPQPCKGRALPAELSARV